MGVSRTKDEWAEIVNLYRNSGQTMKAFCEERGINLKTLGNHVHPPAKVQATRSLEEWRTMIDAQNSSGRNRAAWCREHGVSEVAMRAAERRLKSLVDISEPEWVELWVPAKTYVNSPKEDVGGGSIKIRYGKLEIEAHADYPMEKLGILFERLVR